MLINFKLIQNIGCFDNISPSNLELENLKLKKINLIYGENGRGKTTLTTILKSLGENQPIYIQEKRRLGAEHPPKIVVKASQREFVFKDGQWCPQKTNIIIFDDEFIERNVFSGRRVDSEHCKNLHELIIGAEGVDLNIALQKHIEESSSHNARLKVLEKIIPQNILDGLDIERFCKLENIENVEQKIEAVEQKIKTYNSYTQIQEAPLFEKIELPDIDIDSLNKLLSSSLPEMEAEAAKSVREHIKKIGSDGESWIASGLSYIKNSSDFNKQCPLCAQDLDRSQIIGLYQSYFSQSYDGLRDKIADQVAEIKNSFGENAILAYKDKVSILLKNREFWLDFTDIDQSALTVDQTIQALISAREAVLKKLHIKYASPFENIFLSDEDLELINNYKNLNAQNLRAISKIVEDNKKILLLKKSVVSQLPNFDDELRNLKRVQARYGEAISGCCDEYLEVLALKEEEDKKRSSTREKLNKYREEIFPKYQQIINEYLKKFNANFEIDKFEHKNNSHGSSSDYKIKINGHNVPLKTKIGEPSFENTLSAGDRNTLALAFFFAKLRLDPELKSQIIVIDDPMTSLDEHRTINTYQEILEFAKDIKQLILLSHRKSFLCEIWGKIKGVDCAAFQIKRHGEGSTIVGWDVGKQSATAHDNRCELVFEYFKQGDMEKQRKVAEALRYILEKFMRVSYSNHFKPGDLLGPFINKYQNSIGEMKDVLSNEDIEELKEIVDYANKFHHDSNPDWQNEEINDGELLGFARRTMSFIQRPV